MRSENQRVVAPVHDRVVDGHGRKIRRQRQRHPCAVGVIRDVRAALMADHQHMRIGWMLANAIDRRRQFGRDLPPCLSEVITDVHERPVIVVVMPVECRVHAPGRMPRRQHRADVGAGRQARESSADVRPRFAGVARHFNGAVIGTYKKHPRVDRRLANRGDRAVRR